MRILIYGINYAPELIGIGKYTAEMAVWLAHHGHEVRVVAAPPYYPAWKTGPGYSAWQYRREQLDGVTVWRCPVWVPARPTGPTRLLHLATFALSSLPVVLQQVFWKPDAVFVIEPPLFCAPQALLAARLSRAKAWLHVQDFEVEAFFGLGFASSSFIRKMATFIEALIMRWFDQVSSISEAMVNRIARMGIPPERIVLFPNWVNTDLIRPHVRGRDFREEWRIGADQKIILYSGNMGKKQGLEIVLTAADRLARTHPNAVILMVGDGAVKQELMVATQSRDLPNVLFKPLQPVEDLPSLLAMADLHLIIQKRGAADAVMPSKLTGILAAGGYSVITADESTALGELVAQHPGIAVLVEPENIDALIKGIENILLVESRVNEIARAYAEKNLSREVILQDFERRLFDLLKQHSS